MRRTIPVIAVLIGLLAALPSAASGQASGGAGHNPPTRALEAAYKIALLERKKDANGCYPSPTAIAAAIRRDSNLKVAIAASVKKAGGSLKVFIITKGTTCDNLVMALKYRGDTYVLNSNIGTIRVLGQAPKGDRGKNGKPTGLMIATSTATLSRPDEAKRLETRCPGGRYPLGGGLTSTPAPSADGEGIYPHSYERLGAQRGWHISVVLFDLSRASTTPRNVTIQAVCARGLISANPSPHRTVFIKPGETKSATARCPGGQQLVTGGYQRTNFRSDGGNYITESRAIGTNAWKVEGSAFNSSGGELTSIAYCVRSKRPLLQEVSAAGTIATGALGTVTTPGCPGGTKMTAGGFSFNGSRAGFSGDGYITPQGTWTATGFGYFGAVPTLTAYGYCLRA